MIKRLAFSLVAVSFCAIGFALSVLPLAAATGDKEGWSFAAGAGKSAQLKWVPLSDGPRVLAFDCQNGKLVASSEDVADDQQPGPATLTLANGKTLYAIAGRIAPDPVTKAPKFSATLAEDAQALQGAASKLQSLLGAAGTLKYKIAIGTQAGDMKADDVGTISLKGIASPWAHFKSACFPQQPR